MKVFSYFRAMDEHTWVLEQFVTVEVLFQHWES